MRDCASDRETLVSGLGPTLCACSMRNGLSSSLPTLTSSPIQRIHVHPMGASVPRGCDTVFGSLRYTLRHDTATRHPRATWTVPSINTDGATIPPRGWRRFSNVIVTALSGSQAWYIIRILLIMFGKTRMLLLYTQRRPSGGRDRSGIHLSEKICFMCDNIKLYNVSSTYGLK